MGCCLTLPPCNALTDLLGMLVAMNKILDQFQGTTCNHYVCHPANPLDEENLFTIADLQKMKEQGIDSVYSRCNLQVLSYSLPLIRA